MSTQHAVERLKAISPVVHEICKLTGAPGVSLGIIHQGSVVHRWNYGYRNLATLEPTTSDTIYHIASLSKGFTSVVAGALVDDNLLSLDAPAHTYLPALAAGSYPDYGRNISLADLLSHRAGVASKQEIWYQSRNRYIVDKKDEVGIWNYLEPVHPIRTSMLYNNFGYAAAGQVMEHAGKAKWGELITRYIINPLNLKRTFVTSVGRGDPDYAMGYMVLDDLSPTEIGRPDCEDGTVMAPANGVRSTVNDLLHFYGKIMSSWTADTVKSDNSQPFFRNIPALFSARVPLSETAALERSYASGFVRVQLPNVLGAVGCNPIFIDMPTVGRGAESRLLLYAQGSLPGFTTSVFMFPETETGIVVLTNALGISDTADWIGQLLIETFFDLPMKNDFVDLARRSAEAHPRYYKYFQRQLTLQRKSGTQPKPMSEYTGKYWNTIGNWHIEIIHREGSENLDIAFQGYNDDLYALKHYHDDVFSWDMTRDQAVSKGRFTYQNTEYKKMYFLSNEQGHITSLRWSHEPSVPTGEVFVKAEYVSRQIVNGADGIETQRALGVQNSL